MTTHRSPRTRLALLAVITVAPVIGLGLPAAAHVPGHSRRVADVSVSSKYAVTDTIPVGSYPLKAAIDTTSHDVYVTNDGDDTVSVISEATDKVIHTISGDLGSPNGIAIDSNTGLAWIADEESHAVTELDTASDHTINLFTTSDATSGSGLLPYGVAVDPTTQRVWVTDGHASSGQVSELNERGVMVHDDVAVTDDPGPAGAQPHGIALDLTRDLVFTANDGNDSFSVIKGASDKVLQTVDLEPYGAGPEAIYYDAGDNRLLVTMWSRAGAQGADAADGQLVVFNGSTFKEITRVRTDIDPSDIAADPADHVIFVANQAHEANQLGEPGSVTVINDETLKVEQTVLTTVNGETDGLAVDPQTHTLYAVNESGASNAPGTVSVINLVIDSGPGTIAFGSATDATTAGALARITVTRTGDTNHASTVKYATSNGTAKSGRDYKKAHGTLHFAKGDRFATFKVATIGTKTKKKSLTVHLKLTDPTGGSLKDPKAATLTIHEQAAPQLSDSPPSSATTTTGQKYSAEFAATGRPAPTFAVTSGALPAGIKLNHTTGAVSGTPTVGGYFQYSVTASNELSPASNSGTISLVVDQPPMFGTNTLPTTLPVNQPYDGYDFVFSAFPNYNYQWTVNGDVPPGMTANNGGLYGTPTATGTYTFSVTLSNGVPPAATTQDFTITVQ